MTNDSKSFEKTEEILNFYILNKNNFKLVEKLEFIDFLTKNNDKIKENDIKSFTHELLENIRELDDQERILYLVKLSKFFGKVLRKKKFEKIDSADFRM